MHEIKMTVNIFKNFFNHIFTAIFASSSRAARDIWMARSISAFSISRFFFLSSPLTYFLSSVGWPGFSLSFLSSSLSASISSSLFLFFPPINKLLFNISLIIPLNHKLLKNKKVVNDKYLLKNLAMLLSRQPYFAHVNELVFGYANICH